MKINVLIDNPNGFIDGFVNVDPYANEQNDTRLRGPIHDLTKFVDDGEAELIVADDIIGYFPPSKIDEIISGWFCKLRHGGELVISFADIKDIARQITNGRMTVDYANELIHGLQHRDWSLKKATYSSDKIIGFVESLGGTINKVRFEKHKVFITIKRP